MGHLRTKEQIPRQSKTKERTEIEREKLSCIKRLKSLVLLEYQLKIFDFLSVVVITHVERVVRRPGSFSGGLTLAVVKLHPCFYLNINFICR